MGNNISFNGNVYWRNNTYELAKFHQDEIESITRYANDNECDVYVTDRDYYSSGEGQYETICIPENQYKRIFLKIFDFVQPEKNLEKEIRFDTLA